MTSPLAHRILTDHDVLHDKGFEIVYENSFPSAERESREVVARSIRLGCGMAIGTFANGEMVALATAQILDIVPAVFIVYLAVAPGGRGAGAGGTLFEYLFKYAHDRCPASVGAVWEVDRVADGANAAEQRLRADRIRFFEKHGGHLLGTAYRQPALDGQNVIPMNLMFRPGLSDDAGGTTGVEGLARAMYFDKYSRINGISNAHLEDLLAGDPAPRPAFGLSWEY